MRHLLLNSYDQLLACIQYLFAYSHLISCRSCYIGIYGLFGAFQAVAVIVAEVGLAFAGYFASKRLHNHILSNILRSPMSFFDTTPLGRILNRFSKDVDTVDEKLPRSFSDFLSSSLTVVATIIIICIATPTFLIVVLPVMVLYGLIQVNTCTCNNFRGMFCNLHAEVLRGHFKAAKASGVHHSFPYLLPLPGNPVGCGKYPCLQKAGEFYSRE